MKRSPIENQRNVALIETFMEASGKSLRTVAAEVGPNAKEPNGRQITKDRVSNFVNGRAVVPEWFLAAMDVTYPGWRAKSLENLPESSGQNSTETLEESGTIRRRPMPVIPSLGEADMKKTLDDSNDPNWPGRFLPAPDFLGVRLPMQFVRTSEYAPSFLPGDALLIDPAAEPAVDSISLIFADGAFCYAALMLVEGTVAWVKYDGTIIPYDEAMIEAALVVHLPQYDENADTGAFSRKGLKPGRQIPWPRPVA